MKLEVILEEQNDTDSPAILLVPIPPPNSENRLISFESSVCEGGYKIQAMNSPQTAFVVEAANRKSVKVIYQFERGCSPLSEDHFSPVQSIINFPSHELNTIAESIAKGSESEHDILNKLIAMSANLFEYGHNDEPVNFSCALNSILKGNCSDIHGFLLTCMYSLGIKCSYISGFYFHEGENEAEGFHCWLASQIEQKIQYWDVSQFLMRKKRHVLPGLNPIGGSRVALGVGRGLEFDIGGMLVRLAQFGHPIWVSPDGKVDEGSPVARIFRNELLGGDHG